MVNGITYTKRGREDLLKLVVNSDSAALATSCTSGVTDMRILFYGASGLNAKIGTWDTSSVTTMRGMFEGAASFNQDISEWNTGSVEDFHGIFYGASSFNKDISKWNTASATSMSSMFSEATAFNNGGKALSWADTGNVVSMSYMFSKASAFNQDISTWSTGSVKNMFRMFSDATSFNQDISKWNTAAVTSMHSMFLRATSFNQDISKWNTAKVMDMQTMFESATSFNQDLSSWNVLRVGSTCTRFEANAGAWTLPKPSLPDSCIGFAISTNGVTVLCPIATLGDTGVVKGVTYMKRDRQRLLELKVASNDAELAKSCTSGVTDMSGMFKDAASFNGDIGSWDTSSVTTMADMFNGASTFNQDLSSWNVDKVGSTCTNFEANTGATWTLSKPSLPASCIAFAISTNGVTVLCPTAAVGDTGVVKGVTYTKRDRQRLLELKAASNDAELAKSCTSGVTDMSGMFKDAASFNGDIGSWDTSSVTTMADMFNGATSFNRDLSSWNVDKVGSTCTRFEANAGAWTLSKPSLPASCIAFAISTNGVTVLCPTAAVGDTGVVKGVTYTKRDRQRLLELKAASNDAELAKSCTSGVTDMSGMFKDAASFNGDIGSWDTSSVTTMADMFNGASTFNKDVSKWNTAAVTSMANTFNGATSFNRDLSSWNVDKVGSTCTRFEANAGAWTLSKPSLPASCIAFAISTNGVTVLCPTAAVGDTGVVKGVTYMKRDRQRLLELKAASNDAELAKSCTSGVTDMSGMFKDAASFNGDIGSWDTSSVTTMADMFNGASTFNKDVSKWNTATVTNMRSMFKSTRFNQDISGWNTAAVGDMGGMFDSSYFNQDLSSWNVANVARDDWRCVYFERHTYQWKLPKPALPVYCLGFVRAANGVTILCPGAAVGDDKTIDGVRYIKRDEAGLRDIVGKPYEDVLAQTCTSGVTSMSALFATRTSFNVDISTWDTSSVMAMDQMFNSAYSFNQDISKWNTGKVTTMGGMFYTAQVFNQDIGQWNTAAVTNMEAMFKFAYAFNQYLRGGWDVRQVTRCSRFRDSTLLTQANAPAFTACTV